MAERRPKRRVEPVFSNGRNCDVVIAPSILSADFAQLGRELARCRRARARWIHIDVMDGHFVPNMTMGPPLVKCWRAVEPKLFFDTHLMVDNPMALAASFMEAGSEMITIHVEASRNPARDLRALKRLGLKAGISIKPATPVRAIKDCLGIADLVLVMTVEPGFGGQALIPKTLNKVRELDLLRREHGFEFRLEVDGGINARTAPLAVAAGADVLVAGSAVFGGGKSVAENVKVLRDAVSRTALRSKIKKKRPRKTKAAP
ncbi:ribulose-phosphate 3-epimerase [Candidatus Sumerlaeota bacterium]|nr:ribulose-phosphate 3-epimerase [Candidatus Sumerlaeota bacterium]